MDQNSSFLYSLLVLFILYNVHSLFKTSPYISPDFTISKLGSSCTYGLEGKLRVCVQVCCNLPLILHLQEPKYRALFFSRYSVFSSFSATVGWSDFNFFIFENGHIAVDRIYFMSSIPKNRQIFQLKKTQRKFLIYFFDNL